MSKTLLKTFRLPLDIARDIEQGAKTNKISQAQYFANIVIENKAWKLKKKFDEDLNKMAMDTGYKNEQIELAESNFD